ncbi:MAG: VCBS repeat-containing protein [Bacteroidales bacterium]|nr:VCBS repeat-containing protein [Bacteroidales bacterium]
MKRLTLLMTVLAFIQMTGYGQEIKFELLNITNSVAIHPMMVDVDKNGKNDIVVVDDYNDLSGNDGLNIKTICWFSDMGEKGGGGFKRKVILEINYRSCGIASADIDNDGYIDIIGRYDTDSDDNNGTGSIFWLKNPYGSEKYEGRPWQKFDIGFSTYAKDIVTADFNKDGKTDVVARGVDGFVRVYLQTTPAKWITVKIEAPHHDGTDVADIDNDGDPDIVINGLWYETPSDLAKGVWTKHDYAPRWYQQKTGPNGSWFDNNTKVAVNDIDDDGWIDIFVSNAENSGYSICWYKNPGKDFNRNWQEHEIGYMDFAHTLLIADMDNDGDKDVVSGSLILYNDPNPEGYHPVTIFVNKGNNLDWEKQIIGDRACYSGTAGDLDNDGDIDIVASRNWNKAPLYLWRNLTNEKVDLSSVRITEIVEQGIPSFKIETSSATYIYDRQGGGFISMFDRDGKDWISFKTTDLGQPGNAASQYRGIPNLGIGGEDIDAGHPGFNKCETKVVAPNVIETTTKTGNWKFRWAFYDSYAKLTMVKTLPDQTYWFLYEGTPAGKYDPVKMYWGNNIDGKRVDFPDLLDNTGIFKNMKWVYVGLKSYPRIIYFRQVHPDEKTDLFSYMGSTRGGSEKSPDGMVCFGFGRAHGTRPVLKGDNQEFIIGFIDREIIGRDDHLYVMEKIESLR